MSNIVGIDYSMNSPAICRLDKNSCAFVYWTTKRKYECDLTHDGFSVKGILFDNKDKADEERFDYLASEIVRESLWGWPKKVVMEHYSYASTGRAFQIGENGGVLKNRFYTNGVIVEKVAPTSVKKYATGKGNADKQMMQDAFIEATGIDIKLVLGQTETQWNPSSDIIDAYWIAKYAEESYGQDSNQEDE